MVAIAASSSYSNLGVSMSTLEDAKGPYIVWLHYGYEGWHPYSYDTLKEALEVPKSYEYVITKKSEYQVIECPQS